MCMCVERLSRTKAYARSTSCGVREPVSIARPQGPRLLALLLLPCASHPEVGGPSLSSAAAGEFQYPRDGSACTTCSMPGTELCTHNSRVRSWASLPGDDFVLIGGCELSLRIRCNLLHAPSQPTPHSDLFHVPLHSSRLSTPPAGTKAVWMQPST